MKAYKIKVPVRDYCDPLGVGYESEYTRQEIHNIIEKKAIQLGWKIDTTDYFDDEEYIYLHADGYISSYDENIEEYQEISYQDFLKLTPVNVQTNSSEIPNGSNIEPCEKCDNTDIEINNCNYSAFNCGFAKCRNCKNEVDLSGIAYDKAGEQQLINYWNKCNSLEVKLKNYKRALKNIPERIKELETGIENITQRIKERKRNHEIKNSKSSKF